QPVRLTAGVFRHHGEDDFTWREELQSFFARDQLAIRWEDRRNAHQVLRGDAGVAQRQLKRGQALFVLSHPFGEKDPLRNHTFAPCTASFESPLMAGEVKNLT